MEKLVNAQVAYLRTDDLPEFDQQQMEEVINEMLALMNKFQLSQLMVRANWSDKSIHFGTADLKGDKMADEHLQELTHLMGPIVSKFRIKEFRLVMPEMAQCDLEADKNLN